MILCLGPTPAAQRVMVFPKLKLDEVNRTAVTLDGVAGKAVNVAKVLKSLGQRPLVVTFLGGERGNELEIQLRKQRIALEYVKVAQPTRQCITVIDESARTQTELVQESSALPSLAYEKLIRAIRKRINECRALIMSGTIPPGGPADLYLQAARFANHAGRFTCIDAQGPALLMTLEGKPGLVKPNRIELAATLAVNAGRGRMLGVIAGQGSESAVKRAMIHLCELGAQRVVVTAGRQPTLAFDGQTFWKIASPKIKAVNPIGSGDAFTAALVWRLLRGDDLGEACRWGAAAGAANSLTLMPGEVRRRDVEKLVRQVQVER